MSGAEPVVVIGAGVVGLAIAWELTEHGASVQVLERARPGAGATGAAGGMLAPVSEAASSEREVVDFGLDSSARYPDFVERLEAHAGRGACGYRREGTLWVALGRDDVAEIEHLHETLERRGLAATRLSGSEALALEPHLSPRVTMGLHVAGDHQVDPRGLVPALVRGIEARGGRVVTGFEVTCIVEERASVTRVEGRDVTSGALFTIAASRVIVAAGAATATDAAWPWSPPGLRPVKGQLLRLRGPLLVRHVVRTPHAYLIPRGDGEVLVGATSEERGFDATPTAGAVLDLLRHGRDVLPALYDAEFAEVSVGFRPAVDDHRPVIGASPIEGLYFATAHYRNGVLLAPATAYYLAREIVTGHNEPALEPFAPSRLVARATS